MSLATHTNITVLNSLGFAKAPEDTKVVVAMSGGVDSSVAAAMMSQEYNNVIGITLKLYDEKKVTKSKTVLIIPSAIGALIIQSVIEISQINIYQFPFVTQLNIASAPLANSLSMSV